MEPELRRTICNRDCPDACGIVATVEDGRITRLQGDKQHPVTRGFLCYRTNHFLERQYAPDRITQPLLRKDGELVAVSWDEALDFAAGHLRRIRDESGPAAIFHYRSGGSLGALAHLSDWFFECFGPVTIKRGDICSGAGDAAQMIDFGCEDSNDLFDLANARSIVLWGKNVYTSSPHLLPLLREASARGARLLLVDPVHHRTASLCERYVQVKPARDFDLAMAVARVLLDEGWADPEAPRYCDHYDDFAALARSRTVAEWCDGAGVTAADAEAIARALGPGRPAAILVGWGMGRRAGGGAIVRALDALGAISGNLGVPGGGVSFYFKRRGAFDFSFIRGEAVAPRTVCEPLFGPEVLRLSDPPIRAVWITAGNPVAMLPESETTVAALRSRELVVVVDSWMSDTARLAHLVLPTTTLLEADDLLGAYGHHFLGVARPVVDPPEGARSDLAILQALAARLGLEAQMAGSARDWKQRILSKKAVDLGVTIDRLEEGPLRNPLSAPLLFEGRRFPTESGRVNLVREAPPAGTEQAIDHATDRAIDARTYPLLLMALSTEDSQSSQWARPLEGPIEATVHPEASAGIADGGLARLESGLSSMVVRVRHDARQRPDVALLPKGGDLHGGRCANALVRARTTDIGEGAALYDERVRLVPI
jgi:anaerobic selenocysteine-containing dehydrogenase